MQRAQAFVNNCLLVALACEICQFQHWLRWLGDSTALLQAFSIQFFCVHSCSLSSMSLANGSLMSQDMSRHLRSQARQSRDAGHNVSGRQRHDHEIWQNLSGDAVHDTSLHITIHYYTVEGFPWQKSIYNFG